MSDLINRQNAIMHFVKVSKNYECGMFSLAEVTHELWEIPSAEHHKLNIAEYIHDFYPDVWKHAEKELEVPFEELPSTQRKGKWIPSFERWGDILTTVDGYTCSECSVFNTDKDNYCPNCGADMRGEEDE